MKFDIFLSICQTDVNGFLPTEAKMFENFFDQVQWADELGYETAWVAETHLSCEIQKKNENAVIPFFKGEIGLNTDILQMAHVVFDKTKRIHMGSAIRNILCNGGPIAHAEAIKTFLSLHNMARPQDERKMRLGYASGRFEFSNRPYGIQPRDFLEQLAWPVVKGKVLKQANEIFLRLLKGEAFSSKNVSPTTLEKKDFRTVEEWEKFQKADFKLNGSPRDKVELPCFWNFETLSVIPRDISLQKLDLVLGSHDPQLQIQANSYLPVKVFNLSITPPAVVEETHARMAQHYHEDGGPWKREYMPRTAMIYVSDEPGESREANDKKAQDMATAAWENYWRAMEGTLDPGKVEKAVANTLAGSPETLIEKIKDKYHPEDRLMLWFDFNTHDNDYIKKSMSVFMEKIAPSLRNLN